MSDQNILKDILGFFVGLFNIMKKYYMKLTDLEKQLASYASGIVAIINNDLQATPDAFWVMVNEIFPELTKEQVTGWMNTALETIGLGNTLGRYTFEEALAKLQAYLTGHADNIWGNLSLALAGIFVTVIDPTKNDYQKITSIFEYIYKDVIKPLVYKSTPLVLETSEGNTDNGNP